MDCDASLKKVSVIMPTYNVEQYVRAAVQSIRDQTHSNLEIIIVDDCSTDSTYQILKELEASDSRIRIFKNKKNMKIVHSLNVALSHVTGEYVARMDGDDISELDRIKKQIEFLEHNPQIDLVGTSLTFIDENDVELRKVDQFSDFDVLKKFLPFTSPVTHPSWMVRKIVYDKLDGYRMPFVEDYDFLLRMVTAGFTFTNIPDYYGLRYRIRDGNTSDLYGVEQRKANNYAFSLFKKRLAGEQDLYSIEVYQKVITVGGFLNQMHVWSNIVAKSAAKAQGRLCKLLLYLVAAMLSPYQIQYFIRHYRYKNLVRTLTGAIH